jgi:DNA-binding NarL/FixJ family response regulator
MELFISLLASASLLLSVLAGLTCIALARKLREATRNQRLLATDLDYRLNELRQHLDAVVQHTTAQLQRLTQPLPRAEPRAPEPAVATAAAAAPPVSTRQSVTERRHRVLTLARRGMDVKAIAQTLGMPHGEVGLIIRMSNPKFGD